MKRLITITIILIGMAFFISACNTHQRCPAYSEATIEMMEAEQV